MCKLSSERTVVAAAGTVLLDAAAFMPLIFASALILLVSLIVLSTMYSVQIVSACFRRNQNAATCYTMTHWAKVVPRSLWTSLGLPPNSSSHIDTCFTWRLVGVVTTLHSLCLPPTCPVSWLSSSCVLSADSVQSKHSSSPSLRYLQTPSSLGPLPLNTCIVGH